MNFTLADDLPPPTPRTYGYFAAFVAAFTLYGSFVPFKFLAKPLSQAWGEWLHVLAETGHIDSRTDGAVNLLLGVPLGFALLGMLRVDKLGTAKTVLVGLAVWPACILLAAAAEFGQLFFKDRTSALSDILAQSLGSLAGILAWGAGGQRFTLWARNAWAGRRVGGTAGKLLLLYIGMLFTVQMMPLYLATSPGEVVEKYRNGHVTFIPFGELFRPSAPSSSPKWPSWLEIAGLYAPVGLLLAVRGGRWREWGAAREVLGTGFLLALAIETAQLLVKTRVTSMSDAAVGGSAVFLGWATGRAMAGCRNGLELEAALILGQAWWLFMLAINWHPFDFQRGIGGARLQSVEWIPFVQAEQKNPMTALEEAGTKTLLWAPLGAVIVGYGVYHGGRRRLAFAVGTTCVLSSLTEVGQLFLPTRYAGPTDVVYAILGTWVGAVSLQRLRSHMAWQERQKRAAPKPPQAAPTLTLTPPPHPSRSLPPLPVLDADDPPIHVRLSTTDFDEGSH